MMGDVVLGIDLGTSYFKLGLFDRQGRLCGLGRPGVQTDRGDGDRCEFPVERFWGCLREGLNEALRQAGVDTDDIAAVAYSSQANSFLLLDRAGEALTPLILWPDRRVDQVDPAVQQLWQREDMAATVGFDIQGAHFAIAKLCWLRQNDAELWRRVAHIKTISDYFVFSLTGRHAGDRGTASLLGLWDQRGGDWWDVGLRTLDFPRSWFADMLRPGTVAGRVDDRGAARLGLPSGIPLAVGSLDHHVAATGAGLGCAGDLSASVGTVLACLRYVDEYRPGAGYCIGPGMGHRHYYHLAFDGNGAGGLEWYQREHAPTLSVDELVRLAGQVPIGSDGVLARPQANRYGGRDGFINVTKSHRPGDFVRAIMESTAASLLGLVENLYGQGKPKCVLVTGGGARSDVWVGIMADLLGVDCHVPRCPEPACLGAAMLAGVAAGWFESMEQASSEWVAIDRNFAPDADRSRAYRQWCQDYQRIVAR